VTVLPTFRQRAAEALADQRLRLAILDATTQRDAKRRAAWRDLPDVQALRLLARQIKDHTLDNLDHYLNQFIDNLRRLGVEIHLASSADDANAAVVAIARQFHCTDAVKAKSMLTEETHLNRALLDAGINVVETDLGEFLLQLDDDRPSHLTCPAVHKDLDACAETFARKLDVPFVADPHALVAIARKTMRDKFRSATLAITGVNCAVAESGTIVLVMNEGNGRFCTLAPRVHVAMMGLEKIVPSLADAAVMLKLLGRSATAQRLTVDTHFITGPRRDGELDGASHMHVVIVDAGRSDILAGTHRHVLRCIRCAACLNICPVYRSVGGHAYGGVYPGPIGKLLTPLLAGAPDAETLPHASTLCGACYEACPVMIDIPQLLIEMRRDQAARRRGPRWKPRLIRWAMWLARSPRRFVLTQRIVRRLLRPRSADEWISRAPPPLAGWTRAQRDLPAPPPKSFRQLWKEGRI